MMKRGLSFLLALVMVFGMLPAPHVHAEELDATQEPHNHAETTVEIANSVAEQTDTTEALNCYEHGDVNGDGKVDIADALRVLAYARLPEGDTATQDYDFDGNSKVDSSDALWLLWASMDPFFGTGTLHGTIHRYFDPVWQFNTEDINHVAVTVTFQCGCGIRHTYDTNSGVSVLATDTAPTCLNTGIREFLAKFTFEGKEYSASKQITLPANGHDLQSEQACETGRACSQCDYVEAAPGHIWTLTIAASCENDGVETYSCACGATKTVAWEGTFTHNYKFVASQDEQGEKVCEFVMRSTYECENCGGTYQENTNYEKHEYKSELTKEASCVAEGIKTYTCVADGCSATYQEKVAVNGVHVWDAGAESNGVITYTCTENGCGATKTAVSTRNGESVTKEALESAEELRLEGAAVKLDDKVKEAIRENVVVTVETKNVAELNLSEAQKAQVKDNKIYDFTMTVDGETISEFDGLVTVALPYTLQPGDDVDCIDIWYIRDNGDLEIMQGTYSNDYVTFTTDHFSYYTVTELDPAEYCVEYGHMEVESEKKATCGEDGYLLKLCQRCGAEVSKKILPMTGHDFTEEITAATCTEDGFVKQECKNCGITEQGVLAAKGHAMAYSEELSTAATCTATGKMIQVCANGCDYKTEEEIAQLEHDFQPDGEQKATCENGGYKTNLCTLCGETEQYEQVAPAGHDFRAEDAVWQWNDDYSEATVTLVCATDKVHTKELTAVVRKETLNENCLEGGTATYTATASFNKVEYTNVAGPVEIPAQNHVASSEMVIDEIGHHYNCERCGMAVSSESHSIIRTVLVEADCKNPGKVSNLCKDCGYYMEAELPVNGKHIYNGKNICVICKRVNTDCRHLNPVRKNVDLTAYNICATDTDKPAIWNMVCGCGEYSELDWELHCRWYDDDENVEIVKLDNGEEARVFTSTCEDCGLVQKYGGYSEENVADCRYYDHYFVWFYMDGNLLAEMEKVSLATEIGDPLDPDSVRTVDLSQYGMCGDILQTQSCYCGRSTYCNVQKTKCKWKNVESLDDGNDRQIDKCSKCGVTRTMTFSGKKDSKTCEFVSKVTCKYTKSSKTLYSYTVEQRVDNGHNYKQISAESAGESCEDGIILVYQCSTCKNQYKEYVAEYAHDYKLVFSQLTGTYCTDGVLQKFVCTNCNTEKEETVYDHIAHTKKVYDVSRLRSCKNKVALTECLCGNDHTIGTDYCNFVMERRDGNRIVGICADCSLVVVVSLTANLEQVDKCHRKRSYEVEIIRSEDDPVVFTFEQVETIHDDPIYTYTFAGEEDCTAGYSVVMICNTCEKQESGVYNDHILHLRKVIPLVDNETCGNGFVRMEACACGKEKLNTPEWIGNGCDFVADAVSGADICSKCGLERYQQTVYHPIEGETCAFTYQKKVAFAKNGYVFAAYESGDSRVAEIHDYQTEFQLNGSTCANGGKVSYHVCKLCGDIPIQSTSIDGCNDLWDERTEILYDGKESCGVIIWKYRRCGCGKKFEWREYSGCTWVYMGSEEENGKSCNVYACVDCGMQKKQYYHQVKMEDTCLADDIYETSYLMGDKQLAYYQYTKQVESHDTSLLTYRMLGRYCFNGYYITYHCVDCDYSERDSKRYTEHIRREVQSIDFAEHGGCGGSVVLSRCACGLDEKIEVDIKCENVTFAGTDPETCLSKYTCNKCGLTYASGYVYGERDPETCKRDQSYLFKVFDGEVSSAQITKHSYETVHDWRMKDVTLNDPQQGCEGGGTFTERCADCGEERTLTLYNHDLLAVAKVDLKKLGGCGGSFELKQCACGRKVELTNSSICMEETVGTDPETNLPKLHCDTCGITYSSGIVYSERDPETCEYTFTGIVKTYTETGSTTQMQYTSEPIIGHDEWAIQFECQTAARDCLEGVDVTVRCQYCGKTSVIPTDYHKPYVIDQFDLKELGGCGGKFKLKHCGCDTYVPPLEFIDLVCDLQVIGWDNETGIQKYQCSKCGITFACGQWWHHDNKNCQLTFTYLLKLFTDDSVETHILDVRQTDTHFMDEGICIYCGKTDAELAA